jgi:hypothetical protein
MRKRLRPFWILRWLQTLRLNAWRMRQEKRPRKFRLLRMRPMRRRWRVLPESKPRRKKPRDWLTKRNSRKRLRVLPNLKRKLLRKLVWQRKKLQPRKLRGLPRKKPTLLVLPGKRLMPRKLLALRKSRLRLKRPPELPYLKPKL